MSPRTDDAPEPPLSDAEVRELRGLLQDLKHVSWLWRITKIWATTITVIAGGALAIVEFASRYVRLK